jgi:hypothetical protein
MPYLRLTCPGLDDARKGAIAESLTAAVVDLFFDPTSRLSRDELRERTTVHFACYGDADLYVGARTPAQRGRADVTVELSDWGLSVRRQRRVAAALTPTVARLFGIGEDALDGVNIRFHPYPATDFAVGGRLLADLVPWVGRLRKRLSG